MEASALTEIENKIYTPPECSPDHEWALRVVDSSVMHYYHAGTANLHTFTPNCDCGVNVAKDGSYIHAESMI